MNYEIKKLLTPKVVRHWASFEDRFAAQDFLCAVLMSGGFFPSSPNVETISYMASELEAEL